MGKHITDKGAKKLDHAADSLAGQTDTVPGPSTNAATNLLIQTIILRSIGKLTRQTMEKGLLRRRFDPDTAKKIVENRSLIQSVGAYGVTKLATRSVPGALLVGGGLLVKTLFDRSKSRKASRRAGDTALTKNTKE